MSIFNRLIKQLLPSHSEEENTESEVLVREPIKHSKVFLKEYERWKYNEMHHEILLDLKEKRAKRKEDSVEGVNYYEVQNSTYSGFYFYGEALWSSSDYIYLVHFFTEKLKGLDYFQGNSVREVIEEPEQLKTTEQFYLKPALKFRKKTPYNQLFGNIEIEHKIEDGETKMIKLMASVYNDQHYDIPISFDKLMKELFLF